MSANETELRELCDCELAASASTSPRREEHRNRRVRQAWRTARAGLAAKVVAVIARFITIPLSLQVLGPERYGLWLAVGSVISWLGVSDFGLSAGLVNAVAHDHGREDWTAIRRHVSTAFFGFGLISLVIAAVVLCATRWPGIPRLLGVAERSGLAADTRILLTVCGLFFAASFSLNAVGPLCSALQEGYLGSYVQIAASTLSIASVFALTVGRVTTLKFAMLMSTPALAASCLLAAYLFLVRHTSLRPSLSLCSIGSLKTIAGFGTPLLAVQLGDLGILYSTNVLIANRLGPGQVPSYSVPAAAFMIATTGCYGFAAPYLAAYAEARGRADWDWIRTAALRVLGITACIMFLAGLGMLLFGRFAVGLWTSNRVIPSRDLLFAMSVYYLLMACSAANGLLLVGIGRVKTKAVLHLSVAAVFVGGSWLLMPSLGIVALPVAGILGYLLDAAISLPCALRQIARSATPERCGALT